MAARLAFYQSEESDGVLAPRGWHCAHLYGSSGWFTIIAPEPLDPAKLIDPKTHPLKGPAIQVSQDNGGTSGRFGVARLIARFFPEQRAFLKAVISEGLEPAGDFPTGPYKSDRLIARKENVVEFLTPAQADGLGTASRLVPSDLPIHAAAAVVDDASDDLVGYVFVVRLPKDIDGLAPVILSWAENRYASAK